MKLPQHGFNTALSQVTNQTGLRTDPYQTFNFLVEIEGILTGGFSECSGLQVETEYIDYREGGQNDYIHRFAGPTKYPPLVLKHGLTQLDGLWAWHQEVVRENVIRKNATIYLLDQRSLPVMWWNVRESFPVKWTGPEFRANSNDIAFESVELAHRGLSRPSLSGGNFSGGVDSTIFLGFRK